MSDESLYRFIIIPLVIAAFTAILSLPAVAKMFLDVRNLRRTRLRDESQFAASLAELTGDAHLKRYSQELGYEALAPVQWRDIKTPERQVLFAHADSALVIEHYEKVKPWVMISAKETTFHWRGSRNAISGYRRFNQFVAAVSYFVCSIVAAAPWIFQSKIVADTNLGALVAVLSVEWSMPFIFLAFVAARRSMGLGRAASFLQKYGKAEAVSVEHDGTSVTSISKEVRLRKTGKSKRG